MASFASSANDAGLSTNHPLRRPVMPTLHCLLNGQALVHIGINEGNDVFWCERTDTAYQLLPHEMTGVVIGLMPRCLERRKNVWVSPSSILELARASSDEKSSRCLSKYPSISGLRLETKKALAKKAFFIRGWQQEQET